MFELTHEVEFSAAHRLHSPHLTEEQNRALYGPCHRLHGHNYVLEVAVRGPADPTTGMVMDLNVLSRVIQARIFDAVDHRNLEADVPWLEGTITTAENVAAAFWDRLTEALAGELPPGGRLHRLRLYESRANFVDYYGPDAT